MTHRPLTDTEFEQPWYKYAWLSEVDSVSGLPFPLKNLRDNTLFFQSPANFNDPYDCKVVINPCTYEEWETGLKRAVREEFPQMSESELLREFEQQKAAGSPTRSIERYKRIIEGAKDRFGVFCLTDNPLDMLMWAHYGDKHAGICFQIDVKLCWQTLWGSKVNTDIGHVNYVREIPHINFLQSWMSEEQDSALRQVQEITFSKWDKWASENEIRILIDEIEVQTGTRLLAFPACIYKAVVLGFNTKPDNITAVKTILREQEQYIPIYRVTP